MTVDYLHTSRRPQFADLPGEVRRVLAEVAGSPVASAHPSVTSGFTRAFAALLDLDDGRRVFAKAAGPAAPHARVAIPQEAGVLARLAGRVTSPTLVGSASVDDWELVVLEAIDGRLPGLPWTDPDVARVHDACLALSEIPPLEVATITTSSLALDVGDDPESLATLDGLAAGTRSWPPDVPPRTPRTMAAVAALARRAPELLRGDHLVHCDLRPDNMLVTDDGRVRIVDWNWVTQGPPWADLVSLWPLMARDGIDVAALAATSPLTREVDPEAIDAFLAVLAGYMLTTSGHPTSDTTLQVVRDHQRLMARVFLDLLADRRGWS